MKTRQETFDAVVSALLAQGMPSAEINERGQVLCRYRLRGCKCAVGHLIPDDKYDPKMEGFGFSAACVSPAIGDHDEILLGDLQAAHDLAARLSVSTTTTFNNAAFVTKFRTLALTIAHDYKLDAAVLA